MDSAKAPASWRLFDAVGTAIYNYQPNDNAGKYVMPLSLGESVRIMEVYYGQDLKAEWYKGMLMKDGRKGIFPSSFVKVKEGDNKTNVEREIEWVFKEWGGLLKSYYQNREIAKFQRMKERLKTLLVFTKILSADSNEDTRKEMQAQIMKQIEEGRRLLGLDIIVKNDKGEIATEKNTPIVRLFEMYKSINAHDTYKGKGNLISLDVLNKQSKRVQVKPSEQTESPVCHVFMEFRNFICQTGDPSELHFSLYNTSTKKFLSAEYQVHLTSGGQPTDINKIDHVKTIFSDVSDREIANLILICRVVRVGKLLQDINAKPQAQAKPTSKSGSFRRPFAAAILRLGKIPLNDNMAEFTMPIYGTPQETNFYNIHELVSQGVNVTTMPQAIGVIVKVQIISCVDFSLIEKERPDQKHLHGVTRTRRLSVFPGEQNRNDFNFILDRGEFSQDRKRSAKNVEVVAQIRSDNTGEIINEVVSSGTGEKPASEFHSLVLYHVNNPRWSEYLTVSLPIEQYKNCHLWFDIRHCTTKTAKKKDRAGFAFAFMKLTDEQGAIIQDGTHTLITYKTIKAEDGPVVYLKDATKLQPRKENEHLKIITSLCSTPCERFRSK
eukprot:TRINITY_DN706_c7_g1_i1.p1 TRINITY_DN706_c7_g1~~TRINITY_DN706_c7_g1_i1.p1  ORF type:complete len:607 (+),score=94.56 TRINITY_DN706_c7_g1_i1:7-1827(+)